MTRIAFLGTGVMGREMARALIARGHDVTLFNRTSAKTNDLARAGARIAATPAEAVRDADMVISCVADDAASEAIWLGPQGVIHGSPRLGAIAVESTTVSRQWIERLAARLGAAGFRVLDCPVTGGPDGARAGTLTLLAGGDRDTLDAAWPTLSAYAAQAIHFGPIGAGTAYKLMVNLMGAVQAAALAEGLRLAEKAGLDREQVRGALKTSAVASPLVRYLADRMIDDAHDDVYFAARWRHKDAVYALTLAEVLGASMPASRAAAELFARAVASGLGDKNSSVVIKTLP